MVEFKGPGDTIRSYNNTLILIPAIIILSFIGYVVYRLVNHFRSKKRQKEEKARLKQKRLDRQTANAKNKRK